MLTPVLEQMNKDKAPTEQRDLTAKNWKSNLLKHCSQNEDVWTKIFNENNLNLKKPNIVLFIGGVETGCGII
jgi:predicted metalloprotease